MATTQGTLPPLAEVGHGRIVQGHFLAQAPNLPANRAQAYTQLRLFPGDQISAKPLHRCEGISAHQRITATRLRFTHWGIPFEITHAVVNRTLRKALSAATADHSNGRMLT